MEKLDDSMESGDVNFSDNQMATPMDRFLAVFIDGILMSVAGAIPYVGWLLGLGYFFTKDALPFLDGQSIGKKAMKLRVVNAETGEPITEDYQSSVIRALSLAIPVFGIVDALMVLGSERLRFGDKWAKTKVIKLEA